MNKMGRNESAAVRKLLYSKKGSSDQSGFLIRIKGPYLLEENEVGFRFDEGTARCTIEFEGLAEDAIEVFGMDGIHALALAVDVDLYLKGLASKYDFYWPTGEPYFELA